MSDHGHKCECDGCLNGEHPFPELGMGPPIVVAVSLRPSSRKRTKPETELSKRCRDVIEGMGIPVERIQAGQHRVKGGYLHCASNGTPDLWTPLAWTEIKLPGEELSGDQVAWHQKARAWGQTVVVLESMEQTIAVFTELLKAFRHDRAMGWR